MRRDTKLRAMNMMLGMQAARRLEDGTADDAAAAIRCGSEPDAAEAAVAAVRARVAARDATARWKTMPRQQRAWAERAVDFGQRLADAAAAAGGSYSGRTARETAWGDVPQAATTTCYGDRYSSRCRFSKTDAQHSVTISADGIVDLADSPVIALSSAADGLPLISYHASTGAAVWVETRAKSLRCVHGWIAAEDGIAYHSTQSLEHAQRGLRRKAAAAQEERERAAADARDERRARLIVKVCRGAVATVADARAAGYCDAGIRAWQERHGVGDSAPLADLARTGDPLATQLALRLARSLRRQPEAAVAT